MNDLNTGIDPDAGIDPFEGFVWWMSQIVDASTLQRLIDEAMTASNRVSQSDPHFDLFDTFVTIARQAREDLQ